MPLISLLLLSVAVSPSLAGASQPALPVTSDQVIQFPLADAVTPPQSSQIIPPTEDGTLTPPADICYRIRAYIFKRYDDHAPELVRSTTCGPERAQTRGTGGVQPRLVPAR